MKDLDTRRIARFLPVIYVHELRALAVAVREAPEELLVLIEAEQARRNHPSSTAIGRDEAEQEATS